MRTLTLKNGRRVNRLDRVYSEVHRQWVRVNGVEPDGFVEVCDSETLRVLPDLVQQTQLR
jgi:hypothetical protein